MENPYSTSALIIGLTQIVKMNNCPSQLLPIVAVILGAVIHPAVSMNWTIQNIAFGAFLGLTTTGIIDFGTKTIEKITSKNE